MSVAVRDMRLTLISLLGLGLAPAVLCCAPPPLQARRRVALPSGAQPLRKSSSSSSTQKRRGPQPRLHDSSCIARAANALGRVYGPSPDACRRCSVAAAGPALYELKRVPSQLASMLRMRPRFFGKGTARPKLSVVWDGTLEDGRVLRAARDALDTWRQTDGRPLEVVDPGLRVAALGASILDFSSTDSSPRFDSAARLFEMRSYLEVAARRRRRYDGRTRTHGNHGATPRTTALPARLGRQPSGSLLATAAREEQRPRSWSPVRPSALLPQHAADPPCIRTDRQTRRRRGYGSAAQRVFRMEARRTPRRPLPPATRQRRYSARTPGAWQPKYWG